MAAVELVTVTLASQVAKIIIARKQFAGSYYFNILGYFYYLIFALFFIPTPTRNTLAQSCMRVEYACGNVVIIMTMVIFTIFNLKYVKKRE